MLLIVGLDTLPDLFHNFCSVDGALCLEIIPFRIVLVSYDDYLDGHRMLESLGLQCQSEPLTYPESLRMSPTNFTTYYHTEWYPAFLHTAIEQCLPSLAR